MESPIHYDLICRHWAWTVWRWRSHHLLALREQHHPQRGAHGAHNKLGPWEGTSRSGPAAHVEHRDPPSTADEHTGLRLCDGGHSGSGTHRRSCDPEHPIGGHVQHEARAETRGDQIRCGGQLQILRGALRTSSCHHRYRRSRSRRRMWSRTATGFERSPAGLVGSAGMAFTDCLEKNYNQTFSINSFSRL